MIIFRYRTVGVATLAALLVGCDTQLDRQDVSSSPTLQLEVGGEAIGIGEILELWHENPNRTETDLRAARVIGVPLRIPKFEQYDTMGFTIPLAVGGFSYPEHVKEDLSFMSSLEMQNLYGEDAAQDIMTAVLQWHAQETNTGASNAEETPFYVTVEVNGFDVEKAALLSKNHPIDVTCQDAIVSPIRIRFSNCAETDARRDSIKASR